MQGRKVRCGTLRRVPVVEEFGWVLCTPSDLTLTHCAMRTNASAQGGKTGADPLGSLSPEHEKVLKALWARLLDVFAQNLSLIHI